MMREHITDGLILYALRRDLKPSDDADLIPVTYRTFAGAMFRNLDVNSFTTINRHWNRIISEGMLRPDGDGGYSVSADDLRKCDAIPIRTAIRSCRPGPFTESDILSKGTMTERSVHRMLRRLCDEGVLVSEAGNPVLYRFTTANPRI